MLDSKELAYEHARSNLQEEVDIVKIVRSLREVKAFMKLQVSAQQLKTIEEESKKISVTATGVARKEEESDLTIESIGPFKSVNASKDLKQSDCEDPSEDIVDSKREILATKRHSLGATQTNPSGGGMQCAMKVTNPYLTQTGPTQHQNPTSNNVVDTKGKAQPTYADQQLLTNNNPLQTKPKNLNTLELGDLKIEEE